MSKLEPAARRLYFWGALITLVWAGYELYIRADAMAGPLGMFFRMWSGERVPFGRALTYVDWKIFEIPAYLLLCALTGLIALMFFRRPAAWLITLPLCAAILVYSAGIKALLLPDVWNIIKRMPVLMLLLGSVLRLAAQRGMRKNAVAASAPSPAPYDPFGMRNRKP